MLEMHLETARGTVCYWISEEPQPARSTIVFLHGLTADHRLFDQQIGPFAADHTVIVWDAPAHGRSRPYTDFTYPNAAADLKQILARHGIVSAIMVGQSMGGYIVQSFIHRYPQMVKAFVGIDTSPYGSSYYSRADQWWLRQVERLSRLYPVGLLKSGIAKQVAVTEYGRQSMLAMLEPYGKRELCHLMGIGYAGFLADNRDIRIPCPVLLLVGEQDRTGKVPQYCARWAAKTGYPLKTIKGAAHNANADNAAAVNQAIREFIKSL